MRFLVTLGQNKNIVHIFAHFRSVRWIFPLCSLCSPHHIPGICWQCFRRSVGAWRQDSFHQSSRYFKTDSFGGSEPHQKCWNLGKGWRDQVCFQKGKKGQKAKKSYINPWQISKTLIFRQGNPYLLPTTGYHPSNDVLELQEKDFEAAKVLSQVKSVLLMGMNETDVWL